MKKSTFLLPFAHWSLTTERAQEDVFRALPYKSAGWRTIIRSMVCTLLIGVLMMGAVQNAQANTVQENAVQEDENFQVGENTYETLAAAVSAVPNGGTITLLQDFTTGDDCMLFENKTYTVDFGGHTYTGDGSGDGGGTITIVGGTVTFQNGSVIMTFKDGVALWTYAGNTILKDLTVNATVGTWSAAVYSDGGTTSILSGEYIGGEDAVFRNAGTVTITSGYFKSIYDSARNGCLSGTISMAAGSIIEPAFWNGAKEVTVWPVATAENANFSVGAAYYYTIAQALSAVQEDGTITLLRDLPVSTTFILDANKAYTFDLNNHTLTSAGTVGDIIRIKSGTVTVKNGTIINTNMEGIEVDGCNVILENLTVRINDHDGDVDRAAVRVYNNGTATIVSGSYYGYSNAVVSYNGTVTIISGYFECVEDVFGTGCLRSLRGTYSEDISISAGSQPDVTPWLNTSCVKNVTVTVGGNPPSAFVAVTGISDVPVTTTAGTNLALTGTVVPADATNQTIVWSIKNVGTTGATITDGILSSTAAGTVTVIATITNGKTLCANYVLDFTITVNADQTTDGAGTQENPYKIATAKQLDNLRNYLGAKSDDTYFEIVADIDLSDYIAENGDWTPIGTNEQPFMGNLDGAGHTISNLSVSEAVEVYGNKIWSVFYEGNTGQYLYTHYVGAGLFGYMQDASVTGLTLDGAHLDIEKEYEESTYLIGTLAGMVNGGELRDITVTNSIVTHSYGTYGYDNYAIGGIAGYLYNVRPASGLTVDGVEISANSNISNGYGGVIGYGLYFAAAGGIVGASYQSVVVNAAGISATVSVENGNKGFISEQYNPHIYAGGIVGYTSAANKPDIYMCLHNSYSRANVSIVNYGDYTTLAAGGLAGYLEDAAINNYYVAPANGGVVIDDNSTGSDVYSGTLFGVVNNPSLYTIARNYYPAGSDPTGGVIGTGVKPAATEIMDAATLLAALNDGREEVAAGVLEQYGMTLAMEKVYGWKIEASVNGGYPIHTQVAPPEFIPVTNITGIPTTATAGDTWLQYMTSGAKVSQGEDYKPGTVVPANATHQKIGWNISDTGTTGAYYYEETMTSFEYIDGKAIATTFVKSYLSIPHPGTLVLTAVVKNGAAPGSDYTQDFTITVTFTQSIALNSGVNWISTNVTNTDPTLLNQVKSSLSTVGQQIKASGNKTLMKSGAAWIGTITSLSEKEMYQVTVKASHNLQITGEPVNPVNTPIALVANGWSWIGYTPSAEMPVQVALTNANAQENDQIKSQSGFAQYTDATGWAGGLENMEPGKGYMYFSNATAAKTFCYQNEDNDGDNSVVFVRSAKATVERRWTVDRHRFADNMTVTAVVLDRETEMHSDLVEIAAFVDSECRGSALLQYVEGADKPYMGFLMISGNAGERLTFKVYDHGRQAEYNASGPVNTFSSNAIYGNPLHPATLTFGSPTGIERINGALRIYPNPVKDVLYMEHGQAKIDRLEIFDISGTRHVGKVDFTEQSLGVSQLAAGLYLLKITVNGEISVHKFIKQ